MARTMKKDLEQILRVTNRKLGSDHILAYANGGWCVETADNSRKISGRLSIGRLYQWLEAFNAGIDATEQKIGRAEADRAERERESQMCNGYTNWETFHVQLVVDNDEPLYDRRNELIADWLDSGYDVGEIAELLPDTNTYQEAITQTAQVDEDDPTTEIHVRQQVNWLELAQDNINDHNERQAFEAKRIKEKAVKAAEKFNNRGNE